METLLALDPGLTTGWALFDKDGRVIQMGEVQYGPKLANFLHWQEPDIYVIEQFRVRTKRAGKANQMRYIKEFDEVPAARAIGAIEIYAIWSNKPVYFQEPSAMGAASQMFGLPLNRSHQLNAALHGLFWLHKNRGLLPKADFLPLPEEPKRSTRVVTLGEGESMTKAWKRARKR